MENFIKPDILCCCTSFPNKAYLSSISQRMALFEIIKEKKFHRRGGSYHSLKSCSYTESLYPFLIVFSVLQVSKFSVLGWRAPEKVPNVFGMHEFPAVELQNGNIQLPSGWCASSVMLVLVLAGLWDRAGCPSAVAFLTITYSENTSLGICSVSLWVVCFILNFLHSHFTAYM